MVLFLVRDVGTDRINMGWRNAEYPVTVLPCERMQIVRFRFNPFARLGLELFDNLHHGNLSAHREQEARAAPLELFGCLIVPVTQPDGLGCHIAAPLELERYRAWNRRKSFEQHDNPIHENSDETNLRNHSSELLTFIYEPVLS